MRVRKSEDSTGRQGSVETRPERRSSFRNEQGRHDAALLPGAFWTPCEKSDRVLTIPTI
jgi:hypothetical protein